MNFSDRTVSLLDRAAVACDRRGIRLTELRRLVLGLVLDSPRPAGAYELLDRLRQHHRGAAPPTVYRALDFLLEQGLVHKVERLSAFVGCIHAMQAEAHEAHIVQFLICSRCGRVEELSDPKIGRSLQQAAIGSGFVIHGTTVEADGVCGDCARAA